MTIVDMESRARKIKVHLGQEAMLAGCKASIESETCSNVSYAFIRPWRHFIFVARLFEENQIVLDFDRSTSPAGEIQVTAEGPMLEFVHGETRQTRRPHKGFQASFLHSQGGEIIIIDGGISCARGHPP